MSSATCHIVRCIRSDGTIDIAEFMAKFDVPDYGKAPGHYTQGGGAIMNRSARMPAFGGSLAPTQIRALVAHIRSLCRCAGPAWSRDGAR